MKTRIIVAAIGIPVLLAIIIFTPIWAFGLVVAFISGGAAWEFLRAMVPDEEKRIRVYACVSASLIPICESLGWSAFAVPTLCFALFTAVAIEVMLTYREGHRRMSFRTAALALCCGIVMPVMLSALLRLGGDSRGWPYMLLPFIAAFSSDAGGYFVGCAIGKNKLVPNLSPNKTVEGSAGGFLGAIVCMLIYGGILSAIGYRANFLVLAVYGLLGSLACQLGDLTFSAIKRESGIKDYGTLIPGHGGMLDRFDSMHLTAPMIELLVLWVPAIALR